MSSGGLVTAVAPGSATVTASVSGTSATATTQVTVTELPTALSLSIVSLTQDGQPIDPTDVSGVIQVNYALEAPAAFTGQIRVLIDDQVAATQDLPAGTAAAGSSAGPSRAVPSNGAIGVGTARLALGSEGGVDPFFPVYANGGHLFALSLVDAFELEVARDPDGAQTTFKNLPGFVLTQFEGERQFTDALGREFHARDIDVASRHFTFDDPDDFRIGGPKNKDKVFFFIGGTQEEDFVEVPATEDGVSGTVTSDLPPPDGFGGIESELTVLRAEFEDGQGEVRTVAFRWIVGQDPQPIFRSPVVSVDQVGPTSPNQFSSGVEGEFWVNDTWTPENLRVAVGFRFDETVTDGGSGLAGCQLLAGLPGEEKVPLVLSDLAETVEPRFGVAYDCRDNTDTGTIFPLVDPNGVEQLVGFDFTPPTLFTIFEPQYLQWQQINGPLLLGREIADALSGPATFQASIVHAVLVPGQEQLVRDCILGIPRENGGCEPVDVMDANGNPVEWDMSGLGLPGGMFFLRERAKDGAGNLTLTLGSQFGRDSDEGPTFTTAFGTDGTFTPNGSETITFGGADDVTIRTARVELRYGDPVQLVLGYGGTQPRSDFFSFNSEDIVRSLDVEITVPRLLQSVQVADEDQYDLPLRYKNGPFDVSAFLDDFGDNEARLDVDAPQVTFIEHDFAREDVLWHSIIELLFRICNPAFNGACPGIETEQRIVVRSDTEGADSEPFFSAEDLAAWGLLPSRGSAPPRSVSRSAQADQIWEPLSEFVTGVTITSTTVGDRTQHMYEIVLDATMGMSPGTYEVAILGIDDEGHALMSNSKTFEVVRF